MKMKEFGPPGGGARPWRPPLDPPMYPVVGLSFCILHFKFPEKFTMADDGDLTHCAICFDKYNKQENIPRLLSCTHTLCESCLFDLINTSKHNSLNVLNAGFLMILPKEE